MIRFLQYAFIAIIVTTVGFSLYQWNASRASTQKTAPGNGLVGYWSMNEGTGTSAGDASGNNNTGTLTGGPTWANGKLGKAVSFNGSSDYISMGDQSSLEINNNSLSWGGWFYLNAYPAVNNRMFLIAKGNSGGYEYELTVSGYSTNHLTGTVFNTAGGNYMIATSTTVPPLNTWFHVMAVFDKDAASNAVKLYYNGVLDGVSGAANGTALHTTRTAPFEIGRRNDNAEAKLNGLADDVRVYNRVLSATEIMNFVNTAKLNVSPISNLTSGLVGYWTFDGKDTPWSSSSAGTATDRSGNSNTGTLTNMSRSTSPVSGKLGQALNFDGVDDYVNAGNPASLQLTGSMTIGSWVKLATDSTGIIVSKYTSGARGMHLYYNATNNNIYFCVAVDSGTQVCQNSSTSSISLNTWYFVVGRYDASGQTMKVYIDGVEDSAGSPSVPASQYNASNSLCIGVRPDIQSYFNGQIDDVRIYNRALSAGEVQSLYDLGASDKVNSSVSQNQGTGRLDSGLVGYWKLDDASGTTATDSSTNANSGTLTGGPTWGTGKIGGATDFTGQAYVTIPNSTPLQVTGSMTASFWLYMRSWSNGNWSPIINKFSSDGSNEFNIRTQISSQGQFYTGTGGGLITWDPAADVGLNAWVHVVARRDVNTGVMDMWFNGVKKRSGGAGGAVSSTTQPLQFGAGPNGGTVGRVFDGLLDEVRVYNRAISDEEIAQLYRLTTPTGVDTSLKGYWSFNGADMSGTTAYDRSGSANNGTLTNGPTKTIGKLGQALNFDGTDDYITISDSATLNITDTADITITGWFYRATATTDDTIIAKRNGIANTDDGYILYIGDSTDKLTFEVSENSGTDEYQLESTTTFTAPGWYHYAIVWDQDSAENSEIYLNGVVNSATDTGTIGNLGDLSNALTLNIGSESDGSNPFDGKLDEVRIYNRALGESEIWDMYQSGGGTVNTCKSSSVADADGNTYGTIQIGSQCWMKQNMRVGTRISASTNQTDNATTEKYCYSNSDANCTSNNPNQPDGGLYQWDEMMQYSTTPGARGICPAGWHIPTDTEWYILEHFLDSTINNPAATGYRGTNGGTKLKPNGTSGFEGNLAGSAFSGSFGSRTTFGSFWSSSESGADAWRRGLSSGSAQVFRNTSSQAYGFSARCLQDSP